MAVVDREIIEFFPTYLPMLTVVAVADLPLNAMIQVEALLSSGEGTIPNKPQAGDLIKLTNLTVDVPIDNLSTQTVTFSHYNNISAQLLVDVVTGGIIQVT